MLLFHQLYPFRIQVIMALHYFLPFCTLYKFARLTSVLFCHQFKFVIHSLLLIMLPSVSFGDALSLQDVGEHDCQYMFSLLSVYSRVWSGNSWMDFPVCFQSSDLSAFLLLNCLPSKSGKNSLICYLTDSWDKKQWIHAFHQGSYAKVKQETSQKFDIDSLILFLVLISVTLPTPLER